MTQPDKVANLMQRRSLDVLRRIGQVGKIREPIELYPVKHNVALRMRAIGEKGDERDAESSADVTMPAIDDRARFCPIHCVRAVAGVDVYSGRHQPGIFELEYRIWNRLPLRETGPHCIQFGGRVGTRPTVGSQEIADGASIAVDDIRPNRTGECDKVPAPEPPSRGKRRYKPMAAQGYAEQPNENDLLSVHGWGACTLRFSSINGRTARFTPAEFASAAFS